MRQLIIATIAATCLCPALVLAQPPQTTRAAAPAEIDQQLMSLRIDALQSALRLREAELMVEREDRRKKTEDAARLAEYWKRYVAGTRRMNQPK